VSGWMKLFRVLKQWSLIFLEVTNIAFSLARPTFPVEKGQAHNKHNGDD
jgi:hypothetical protein